MVFLSNPTLSVILLLVASILSSKAAIITGNETDFLALLAFKDGITHDPTGVLSSWKETATHPCQWEGILCSNDRVIALDLEGQGLVGSLTPYLANLTSLQQLYLGENSLRGEIPTELGRLTSLRILNLSSNSLHGHIPTNLSSCKQLTNLELSFNSLTGNIPVELTSLPKLDSIQIIENNLTGSIPREIGNLSSLTTIALGRNFLEGSIPDTIGLITRLNFLQVAENQLSGTIPPSLYNLSALTFIAIATNQLHGVLLPDLGLRLPKLDTLYVGGNQLTGSIPTSLLNASGLMNLDLAYNNFSGSVPKDLGRLSSLLWLNFEGDQLGTGGAKDLDFIDSLTNCTNLQVLDIGRNRFGGALPSSIANLSAQLSMLIMDSNSLRGTIPQGIENLVGLSMLLMHNNLLIGGVPRSIGRLQNMQILSLFGNQLSGFMPSSLGNLTQLIDFRLQNNAVKGSIPSSLGRCKNLQLLDLSGNKLSGVIPTEVINIPSLSKFLSLAHNTLIGHLPMEIGNLKNIAALDISENKLSGEIPESLGDCISMEQLAMQGNNFGGSIPSSFRRLAGIEYIDLSRNNLSGQVPDFLGSLHSLLHLNLSFNDFEGVLPKQGVFQNTSAISVVGNIKLCGGVGGGGSELNLPACPVQASKKWSKQQALKIALPVVCATLVLALLLCLYFIFYKSRSRRIPLPIPSFLEEPHMKVSYKELLRATGGFSSANLIGEGSFGTVYKCILEECGSLVAVKVINLQHHGASSTFIAECEALRHVRHRNLVKILTCCSSLDFAGNEFKALIYEFMPNGSLEKWLHPDSCEQHHSKVLNFFQRLYMSIHVASALDYLHHQCEAPIVHCDLKPSNVLLDNNMIAHVGDFGLAKILLKDVNIQPQTSSIGIRGSIGYVPPEYGMGGEVTTRGDVFSYGILLLEMFTGKRPTDDVFDKGSSLVDLAKQAFPQQVTKIVDRQLFSEGVDAKLIDGEAYGNMNIKIEEGLVSVIELGLSCCSESPKQRPEMRDVVVKLKAIKNKLL